MAKRERLVLFAMSLFFLCILCCLVVVFYMFWFCPAMEQLQKWRPPMCTRKYSQMGLDTMLAMQAKFDVYWPKLVSLYETRVPAAVRATCFSGVGAMVTGTVLGMLIVMVLFAAVSPSPIVVRSAKLINKLLKIQAAYSDRDTNEHFALPVPRLRRLCAWLYGPISNRRWAQIARRVFAVPHVYDAVPEDKPAGAHFWFYKERITRAISAPEKKQD